MELTKPPKRRQASLIMLIGGYINIGVTIVYGIVIVPLFLHYIGIRLYGLWLASGGIIAFLAFMEMGLNSITIQRVSQAYGKKDYEKACLYFINSLFLITVVIVLFLLAVVGISYVVPGWLKADPGETILLRDCIILIGIANGITILNYGIAGFAQALQRPLYIEINRLIFKIVGIVTVVVLLIIGKGLYSLPIGALVEIIPILVINSIYSFSLHRSLGGYRSFNKTIIWDYMRISPFVFGAKIGNALVGRIEPTIITILIAPELAVVYSITRKIADAVKLFLDRIGGSAFASFSHLYGEGNNEKSARVLSQIMSFIFYSGIVGFGIYMVGNRSFIGLWVGPEQFAGQTITLLIAISTLFLTVKDTLSYFLGATGDISISSLLNLSETITRFTLMVPLLLWLGLAGLPTGMLISSILFSALYYLKLKNNMPLSFLEKRNWLKPLLCVTVIITISTILGYLNFQNSWMSFIFYMLFVSGALAVIAIAFNKAAIENLVCTYKRRLWA